MSALWRNWLNVWCWLVVGFGIVLAGGGFDATDGGIELLFGILGPQAGELTWTPHLRFSTALMGAVTIGWGLTFLAAFGAAHRMGDQAAPVWRMLTVAVVAWFVIDGALSAAAGFAFNIAPNTALLIGYLLPVLAGGVLKRKD